MSKPLPRDLEAIAAHFAALWRALSQDDAGPRPPAETRLLTDSVRDALDRRLARLQPVEASMIANSFTLEALAHEGLLTQIYRLRQRDLGTLHALKTLRPDQADDVVARELLLREARFGTRLRHRHLAAPSLALRLDDGRPALLLDWLPASLADRLNAGPFSGQEVAAVATAMLSGLQAVHAAGLVHADLAPDNLIYDGENLADLRIADFGIALEAGQRHGDLDLAQAGREAYSAPEQQAGQALDGRADLFACGRILHELLERCGDAPASTAPLARLAACLVHPGRDARPASAQVALALLAKGLETG